MRQLRAKEQGRFEGSNEGARRRIDGERSINSPLPGEDSGSCALRFLPLMLVGLVKAVSVEI